MGESFVVEERKFVVERGNVVVRDKSFVVDGKNSVVATEKVVVEDDNSVINRADRGVKNVGGSLKNEENRITISGEVSQAGSRKINFKENKFMNDRARNVYEMFIRILAFHLANAADYIALAIAAAKFAEVQAAADALEAYFAEQQSGDVAVAVELRAVLRGAIKRKMTPFRKTAKALSQTVPGIDKSFVPFHSANDATLVAIGRDYVDTHAANEAAFTALGLPKQKRLNLAADLDSFEDALTTKATAQQESVGATAGIDVQVQTGMDAAEVLDAVMRNFYTDDQEKLAEWKTARHVKRASQSGDDDPPTP